MPIWFPLERHAVFLAAALACANTGNRMAARIAMIAMTTRSSISVKPALSMDPPGIGSGRWETAARGAGMAPNVETLGHGRWRPRSTVACRLRTCSEEAVGTLLDCWRKAYREPLRFDQDQSGAALADHLLL